MDDKQGKKIPLTQGKSAIVDDEDYDFLNQWKWTFSRYAVRTGGNNRRIYMHQIILPYKKGFEIDHINQNKLDNRRENLRYVTRSENIKNGPLRIDNSSGFEYVYYRPSQNRWYVEAKENHKKIWYGQYKTKEEAANVARRLYDR